MQKSQQDLFKLHKFPTTRYQGSKYKLREWIKQSLIDLEFETAIDAFSGTSSVGYVLKEMGKQVYSNDILRFNYFVSKALIENSKEQISEDDIISVITRNDSIIYSDFIKKTFQDIYYTEPENEWLDIVAQNILLVENKHKQAMLYWALYQSCIAKRPYNLFHRKNLYVRTSDVDRKFGNKTTWDKPFEQHFRNFIKEINNAIFDNLKPNMSFWGDVFDLNISADLVYIDTPYIPIKGTLTLYGEFYHFLDGLTDYKNWGDKIDYNSKHKKLHQPYSIWEDKKNILLAFEKLISKFKNSIIVISYREDGIPSIEELTGLLLVHNKTVKIKSVEYKYVLSKKQNAKEVLIIAE